MDSLSRGAIINGASCTPFNSTRTSLSSPPSNIFLSSNSQSKLGSRVRVRVSVSSTLEKNPIIEKLQSTSKALIFTAAAALMIGRFSQLPAKAESPVATIVEEEQKQVEEHQELQEHQEEHQEKEKIEEIENTETEESRLSQFIESHSEAIDDLKSLLQSKLEDGEEVEALKILKRLISAEPLALEWKLFIAKLYHKMGEKTEALNVYEDIFNNDPLCSDYLLQNAMQMEHMGEGNAAFEMLIEKLNLAKEEQNEKEARNVRLIIARIQYLQKNVEDALKNYEELAEEDPEDYRPYFYRFLIYNLLDRNEEANLQFARCSEICPETFKVEGLLQTSLSELNSLD